MRRKLLKDGNLQRSLKGTKHFYYSNSILRRRREEAVTVENTLFTLITVEKIEKVFAY